MKALKLTICIFGSILILFLDTPDVNAQKSHFTVSVSPILPLASLKDQASWGFLSGKVNYGFDLTQKLTWNLSAAFNRFGTQTVTVDFQTNAKYESALAFIPLTTGFQYFLNNNNSRFYLVAQGGYYFPSAGFQEGDWGFSPGLGMQIPLQSKNLKIDISIAYNRVAGGTTEPLIAYSQYGGSVTTQTWYNFTSYIAVNIGVVLGK